MLEKEIDETVVKHINDVSGQKIELRSNDIHFTEYGERYHKVTFDGALGRAFRNIAYVIGFVLEKEEAERTTELKIRNLGLPNIPQLTLYEEFELFKLQEKIKLRTTPIQKLEPKIELLF